MITEDYVSFEVAKLLKEKGFDENTNCQYPVNGIHSGEVGEYNITDRSRNPENYIPAPTLQMVMKWLREKSWIICVIPISFHCGLVVAEWGYNIWTDDNLEIDEATTPRFSTYEEACESAIKYCLKNLI